MFFVVTLRPYYDTKKDRFEPREKGVCSCGEIFDLLEATEYEDGLRKITTKIEKICCPRCGALYGNVHFEKAMSREDYDKPIGDICLQLHSVTRKCLARIQEDGDSITILKESFQDGWLGDCFQGSHSYALTFTQTPVICFKELLIDGRKATLSRSNIKSATGKIGLYQFGTKEPDFMKKLRFASGCIASDSFPQSLLTMYDYPVVESVYNNADADADILRSYRRILNQALKDGVVYTGERSERKAFHLTRRLLACVRNSKVSVAEAQTSARLYGEERAAQAIEMCAEVLGQNFDAALVKLLCELTRAEQLRLIAYLTHDVDVYQGISNATRAWSILKDYRKMCMDMDITPELCPKSLKLQHDMASRNYKLCVGEEDRAEFIERVKEPTYQKLAWTSSDGQWAVLVPTEPQDIILEGQKQSHCVGSYVSYVIEGKYRICFLRRTENLSHPVLTLTVDKEDCCLYYKGFDNRPATMKERAALNEWAKVKHLTLSEEG